ncbi:MAG: hypothetical protein Hyperionvirus2_127 [Hyperionvirus sp.]|uniref:Uncharacterized protein n=1 Tax=Hyperionvirus sp. TaxID=2487770 RepID=A0A3G5ABT7_9VIRU|nr:MAG: hypothetical protein Hyperionvirus2_127 [Hyperionvirus sp.]
MSSLVSGAKLNIAVYNIMFIISDSGYKGKKFAVFLLCYGSDYYLMGLLCTLYAHQKLVGADIEIVVMCDEYIYKFKEHFEPRCDRIVLMNMDVLQGHHHLYKVEKYSQSWMNYIINKWHCLYFDEYAKILFIDIDILVADESVYDIFTSYSEPYIFSCRKRAPSNCVKRFYYGNFEKKKYKDHYDYTTNGNFFLDGGFVLLTPGKKLHDEYYDFLAGLDFQNKKIISQISTIDEVTLFYFIVHVKNLPFNCIKEADTYIIPWKTNYLCDTKEEFQKYVKQSNAFNYLSEVKPWNKPIPLMWPEEYIWKIIEQRVISGSPFLKALSVRNSLYCYLYLDKNNDKTLQITNKSKRNDVYKFIEILKKKFGSLTNKIFGKQAYDVIKASMVELLSYKEPLNALGSDVDLVGKCCGVIEGKKYKKLIYE